MIIMKTQVLSIGQMQRLKELGVDTSKASMHWEYLPTPDAIINGTDELGKEPDIFVTYGNRTNIYPTFTLQDILEILSEVEYETYGFPMLLFGCNSDGCSIFFRNPKEFTNPNIKSESMLEAAYKMLCWVAENGHLKSK